MREEHRGKDESKRILYEELEEFARVKIRQHLQDLLEQEVSEWLGREKSERKVKADEQPGYRNGYGRPRRLTMSLGTIEIQRPRVRDLSERFKSRVLPMFRRQTQEVRELIPSSIHTGWPEVARSLKVIRFYVPPSVWEQLSKF